eukprot:1225118-Pyramimonas_sp.AAC.2
MHARAAQVLLACFDLLRVGCAHLRALFRRLVLWDQVEVPGRARLVSGHLHRVESRALQGRPLLGLCLRS